VVRAFASVLRSERLAEVQADATLLEDVGYSRADAEGPVDFRTAAKNLTALATVSLGRRITDGETRNRRAEVHIYFRYLERVWQGHRMLARA
jgi:hypothetical protein